MATRFERELGEAQRPLTVAELEVRQVSRGVRRGPAWRSTSRGRFVSASAPEATPTQRILEAAGRVPATGALSGWAAAFVQGADHLDGHEPGTGAPDPVLITLGRDVGRRPAAGIRWRRDPLPRQDRSAVHGLPVTTPVRATFDGVRLAPSLTEAVAFLDAALDDLEVTEPELRGYLAGRRGWRGVTRVEAALALADPRAVNPWESRLRMLWMLHARLPRPLVNVPVFGLDEGFLGIPDLLDPDAGLVAEFDGQGRRERRQHRADNVREEKLEGANLQVCRADSLDLLRHRSELTGRLTAKHAAGLTRDRSRDRWTLVPPPWWLRRAAT